MKRDRFRSAMITAIAILFGLLLPSMCRAEESASALHTKTFKVNLDAFYWGLQSATTLPFGGSSNNIPTNRFSDIITNIGTVETAEDGSGRHLRYSFDTENEMRLTIASVFYTAGVNLAPPKGMAFDDRRGTITVRATDDDLKLIEQTLNKLNVAPPPEVTVKARYVEVNDGNIFKPEFEWLLKMITTNSSSMAWIPGILTEPLFNNIKQKNGAHFSSETEVTTLSGRQAHFDLMGSTTAPDTTGDTNGSLTLDVVPQVNTNGNTIELTLIPTVTQFLGPAPSSNFVATETNSGAIPFTSPLPLPRTRVRQVIVNCTMWDGQTAVLLVSPNFKTQQKNNIVIFVTPLIIDAAGNRKDLPEDMPFAQKAVPAQPAR